jgi:plasmid stabilization system protein ParE
LVRVLLSGRAFADLERLEAFLHETGDPLAGGLLDFVFDALHVLTHQPGIGRQVADGLRELIISRGRGGYLARYHLEPEARIVRVLRIRHQLEAGYADGEV